MLTFSLANEAQGAFTGYVENGMTLVGSSSGARATITGVKLVTDLSAHVSVVSLFQILML